MISTTGFTLQDFAILCTAGMRKMPLALTDNESAATATLARMKSPLVAMEGAAGTAVAMEGVAAAEAEVAAAESKSSTHNFFLA